MNALKKTISMSAKEISKQRVKSFLNELEQGTSSLTDEEFTRLERMIMERRGHAAAHVVVPPIDTAQPCNPRPRCSEILFDVHVCTEENTEGGMDPEPGELEQSSAGTGQLEPSSAGTGQLEPSSAGTGQLELSSASTRQLKPSSAGTGQLKSPSAGTCFKTPGQPCLPNWEMG